LVGTMSTTVSSNMRLQGTDMSESFRCSWLSTSTANIEFCIVSFSRSGCFFTLGIHSKKSVANNDKCFPLNAVL
jgi:hypothetical protein